MYFITTTLLIFLLLFVVRKIANFWSTVESIGNTPGFRTIIGPAGLLGLLPRLWRHFNIGSDIIYNHYADFKSFGLDIVSAVYLFPRTSATFWIADPIVIKEILSQRVGFPKPVAIYKAMSLYGSNVVVSEGGEWKRLRKVCAPAFTKHNAKLVWDETVRITDDLFHNIWQDRTEVAYDNALDLTLPLALYVIGAAGFGYRMTWKDAAKVPNGHKMSFQETLATVSNDIPLKVFLPDWLMLFTSRTRRVRQAFRELEIYVAELVDSHRNADNLSESKRHNLLSNLLAAGEGVELTDREIFSNIFIFLIAGHETTSHTLCFALGLLALYPEAQQQAYEELTKAFPDGRSPTHDDIQKLTYVQCILYETLRMFPPVTVVPKYATKDATFVTKNHKGENVTFIIPAGSRLMLHVGAAHHHPRFWSEPETFNPSRFLGDWPKDAFLPFSGGMRSCLGRRFAELESLAFLSMLIMRFKIELNPEPEYAHETFEERRDRVLSVHFRTTITPTRVPILLTRRI